MNEQIKDPDPDILIPLQLAHMTQHTLSGIPGDWYVRENITGRDLHTLPSTISDRDMFALMDFSREFELEAFNTGIKFQKQQQNAYLQARIDELVRLLEAEAVRSNSLSLQLQQLMVSQEN